MKGMRHGRGGDRDTLIMTAASTTSPTLSLGVRRCCLQCSSVFTSCRVIAAVGIALLILTGRIFTKMRRPPTYEEDPQPSEQQLSSISDSLSRLAYRHDGGGAVSPENASQILLVPLENHSKVAVIEHGPATGGNGIGNPQKESSSSLQKPLAGMPARVNADSGKTSHDVVFPQVIVHLDLKGAPPTVVYLREFFKLILSLGATGVLIEWEDTFPYRCLKDHTANTTGRSPAPDGLKYSDKDVEDIMRSAIETGLTVIPLVQTFGHMEHVLKRPPYVSLRENPLIPEAICPRNEQAFNLILSMVDEVVDALKRSSASAAKGKNPNPDNKWFHLGMDEVFQLGLCPKCTGTNPRDLFIHHVKRVSDYVIDKHKLTPIIWADMLTKDLDQSGGAVSAAEGRLKKLGNGVEPMFWLYGKHLSPKMNAAQRWFNAAKFFSSAWVASAFKGADGSSKMFPNLANRLQNHLAWLDLGQRNHGLLRNGFNGIVITGWSRYNHFMTMSELLPAAIPSLAISLALVNRLNSKHGYQTDRKSALKDKKLFAEVSQKLSCPAASPLLSATAHDLISAESDNDTYAEFSHCGFPGATVLGSIRAVDTFLHHYSEWREKEGGWLNVYNLERKFIHVGMCTKGCLQVVNQYRIVLDTVVQHVKEAFDEVFQKGVMEEFVEQRLGEPIRTFQQLEVLLKLSQPWTIPRAIGSPLSPEVVEGTSISSWPGRPLSPASYIRQFLDKLESEPHSETGN